MANESLSRRDILRTLAVGAAAGSVLQVIPAEAAEYVHQMVHKEKSASPAGNYTPKYFSAAQYATLLALCDMIIPKDEKSGGAVEARSEEHTSELQSHSELVCRLLLEKKKEYAVAGADRYRIICDSAALELGLRRW